MSKKFFIAGTDTDIGKTYVATKIIEKLKKSHNRVLGIKPIATGGCPSSDALKLQEHSHPIHDYQIHNPVCLQTACSVDIACKIEKKKININSIVNHIKKLEQSTDALIVEGLGGWLAPIDNNHNMNTLAMQINYPVILVVGIKLGCLNHAQLTERLILQDKLPIAGWIANCPEENINHYHEQVECLKRKLSSKYLGSVSYKANKINLNQFCLNAI